MFSTRLSLFILDCLLLRRKGKVDYTAWLARNNADESEMLSKVEKASPGACSFIYPASLSYFESTEGAKTKIFANEITVAMLRKRFQSETTGSEARN